jgi:CheY-like chemotaxis protein
MPTDAALPGGSETILVVDDEAIVLRFCNTVLSGAGYRVITAPDAHAALEIYNNGRQRIDLALVDAIMPGMSGPALADCLTGLGASVRVLMMSGYPEDTIIQRLGHWVNYEKFLRKPFKPPVLLSAIRETLETPASRAAQ